MSSPSRMTGPHGRSYNSSESCDDDEGHESETVDEEETLPPRPESLPASETKIMYIY